MRAGLMAGMLLCVTTAQAQNYEIVDQAERVRATVQIQRGQLVVQESTGETIVFSREPRYDSPDGGFLGYFSRQLQRVLRFPRNGQGVMQIADLDDPQPRFRQTLRRVRPATGVNPRRVNQRDLGLAQSIYGPEQDYLYGYQPAYPYAGGTNPYSGGFGWSPPPPQSILLESKTIPNPALPPVKLELFNSGPRNVVVTVVDLRTDDAKQMQIRPRQRVEIEVARDSGSRRVERYQAVAYDGRTATRQVEANIPPAVLYEVVVHERVIQSIAIDRTGKSPSPIEDINYRGDGLGRFVLPPGDQLKTGSIDVYRVSLSANNQRAVAPITAQEKDERRNLTPLERVLQQQQRAGN